MTDLGCDRISDYGNRYTPMGYGSSGNSAFSSFNAFELNRLGFLADDEIPTVELADDQATVTETIELRPIGGEDFANPRGLRVVAPDGRVLWLEYRDGSGIDAGAQYTNFPEMFPAGVVVTEQTSESDAVALNFVSSDDPEQIQFAVPVGVPWHSGDITAEVVTVAGGTATVRITVADPDREPTQAPSSAPTLAPTSAPSSAPTQAPTSAPTQVPTSAPTQVPTSAPTEGPSSSAPTSEPGTPEPTDGSGSSTTPGDNSSGADHGSSTGGSLTDTGAGSIAVLIAGLGALAGAALTLRRR
ncbi:hypothetical protein [Naumannella halotolerans]|uniref:Gram-positive cocci surface proteins LPxTG domain-containing protein n=1 Tax=Naumannella halotolerans TaxID=993414 RepID=A0A4R7JA58_9ACTN|nr:hypothetical protein [Naumannella halotolerans]TDT34255.1 hypothetical protein CLV29_1913 [Naumannella halotolerans]